MTQVWLRIKVFTATLLGSGGAIWGFTEAYTYFTGDKLKGLLGHYWWLLFYIAPLTIALFITLIYRSPTYKEMADKKVDKARKKIQKWGKRITYDRQWDWHLLGQALHFAREALEYNRNYQRPWTLLADIYHRIGKIELARKCLEKSYDSATRGPNFPGNFYKEVERNITSGYPFNNAGGVKRQSPPEWFEEKWLFGNGCNMPQYIVVNESRSSPRSPEWKFQSNACSTCPLYGF